MFLTSLYFSNAVAKPFLLYSEVNFSSTFLWLAIARHIPFLLKLFYFPGRTGGFVFARDQKKQAVSAIKLPADFSGKHLRCKKKSAICFILRGFYFHVATRGLSGAECKSSIR